jgi:cytochrome d ubiquinol oxidase subunit I
MRVLLLAAQVSPVLGPVHQQDMLWARELQAMSFAFHIPLVCFGVAFPAMVVFMECLGLRTGDDTYRAIAKRWSGAMTALFAVGVVTGTILSFELGLLWPEFMATFGSVFGVAFGIEGFSFFIEAIFIAMYIYGWERIPRRRHPWLALPIVITGLTGSMTVISVNGWMNHPVGFDVAADGSVTNVRPWEALFNPNLWHELVHMYVAGYMVAGFVVAGIYALAWLRGDRSRYARAALVVPLAVAALASPVQVLVGDWAGRTVAHYQPTKLAAFEGVYKTGSGVALHVGGVYSRDRVKYGIPIPRALSLLARHDPNATIQGLDAVPPRDRPPVNVVRFSFQTMVGIGTLLALLGVWFAAVWWRHGRLPRSRWFYRGLVAAGPLSLVALLTGWVTTEVGRQPWIVYRVMRTEQAVTNASGLPIAFVAMLAVYLALTAAAIWIVRRLAARPAASEAAG